MQNDVSTGWLSRRLENVSVREGDHRSPFQRDKARILHSAAFRRLQSKTQVLGVGYGDFHRTRLTHSIEVSQIGHGIAAQLRIKQPELAHSLHQPTILSKLSVFLMISVTPVRPWWEIALHHKMYHHGGFEGNAQTFRIVTQLEPYSSSSWHEFLPALNPWYYEIPERP